MLESQNTLGCLEYSGNLKREFNKQHCASSSRTVPDNVLSAGAEVRLYLQKAINSSQAVKMKKANKLSLC